MPRTARFLLSLGNVLFSLVLGAVALAFALFFFPAATLQLYKGARAVGEALLPGTWPAQYEPVLRALTDVDQRFHPDIRPAMLGARAGIAGVADLAAGGSRIQGGEDVCERFLSH